MRNGNGAIVLPNSPTGSVTGEGYAGLSFDEYWKHVDKDHKKEILTFHKDVVFEYSVCMSCKFFASYCIDSLSDNCQHPGSAPPVIDNSSSYSRLSQRSSHHHSYTGGSKKSQREHRSMLIVQGEDGSFSGQPELTWKEDTAKKPHAAQIFARYIDSSFYLHPASKMSSHILEKVAVEGSSRCITTGSPTGTDSGGDVSACWCCGQFTKGMVWIRFVNMLTYPYPVRKFRMLLRRETTVGELLNKLKAGIAIREGERIVLQHKGHDLELRGDIGIIEADLSRYKLIAISKLIDPEAMSTISRQEGDMMGGETVEKRQYHVNGQKNKQFVGKLLFGHMCGIGGLYRGSPSSEGSGPGGRKLSIVETCKLDVGFRVLSLLLQDLVKKSVLCAWHREQIAHWHSFQLALVLEREEERKFKKKDKKLKKRMKEKERKLKLEESKQRLKRSNRIIATTTSSNGGNGNCTNKNASPTSEERVEKDSNASPKSQGKSQFHLSANTEDKLGPGVDTDTILIHSNQNQSPKSRATAAIDTTHPSTACPESDIAVEPDQAKLHLRLRQPAAAAASVAPDRSGIDNKLDIFSVPETKDNHVRNIAFIPSTSKKNRKKKKAAALKRQAEEKITHSVLTTTTQTNSGATHQPRIKVNDQPNNSSRGSNKPNDGSNSKVSQQPQQQPKLQHKSTISYKDATAPFTKEEREIGKVGNVPSSKVKVKGGAKHTNVTKDQKCKGSQEVRKQQTFGANQNQFHTGVLSLGTSTLPTTTPTKVAVCEAYGFGDNNKGSVPKYKPLPDPSKIVGQQLSPNSISMQNMMNEGLTAMATQLPGTGPAMNEVCDGAGGLSLNRRGPSGRLSVFQQLRQGDIGEYGKGEYDKKI